jgi:hypothetical protein
MLPKYTKCISTGVSFLVFTYANAGCLKVKKFTTGPLPKWHSIELIKPLFQRRAELVALFFTHWAHSSEKISCSQCYLNEINKAGTDDTFQLASKVHLLAMLQQNTIFRSTSCSLYMELSITAMNFVHNETNIKSTCYFYSSSALLGLVHINITPGGFNITLQKFICHHIHTVWDYFPGS